MIREPRHLVFDVGGTQLRAAVYDGAAASLVGLARADAPSFARHPGASWADLRGRLIDAMSALRDRVDPAGASRSAAVAFPGPVDGARRVIAGPTIWGSLGEYPYALEDELHAAWPDVEVRVCNDVTAAGFRYLGAADDDFCVVAVSTGIGNKVFTRGRPLLGPSGLGGEIGHLQVDPAPDAPPCDCGGRGHVGALASGRGVSARAKERARRDPEFGRSALAGAPDLSAEAVAAAYRAGDAWAGALVREGAGALGIALAAVHLAAGVDRFVLIGGFAMGLGPRFCDDVRAAIDARCWRGGPGRASVTLGESDGHCALLGGGRAKHLGLLG